jgi:cephalosporin-C deacetylase-like acetyl esterase
MEYDNRKTSVALSKFNTFTTTYKTINNHAITVDVHVPKNVQSHQGRRPIAVRFHGGGLVCPNAFSPIPLPQRRRNKYTQKKEIK